ncbi:hypothetical protein B0H16DRAFT_1537075 [Mycena metata]|uniref:F-box domain-containing protein n=1 Tax=Mycena metata TaxID=1033252 RepID=A0AAD7J5F4_9AGAR|nr:hypothetical protein B0H16DRAFT_1537075 [Mycena metata]
MLPANLDLRAQLAAVDAAIAELRSRLKALEDVRGPIQRQLNRIVYPVLTLPPEIVTSIFLQYLSPPAVFTPRKKTGSKPTLPVPLLLLQICRVWREIALSAPDLWSCLYINTGDLGIGSRIWDTEVVSNWFGRAGSCPLTFSLKDTWPLTNKLFPILSPLAPRLQNLYLDTPDQFEKLADIGPFPILETLAICHPNDDPDAPLKIFPTAPRLHHILFKKPKTPRMWIIPPSVKKVTCATMSVNGCIDLLQRGPFLEELSCNLYRVSTSHTKVITHNHLETLRLSGRLSGFIRLFQLPALHNLYLSPGSELEGNFDHFPSFLASTSVRLFHAAQEISSLAVEWFATSMPGLVDLELCNPQLQFFSRFLRDPRFLPHLRTLAFQECDFELDAAMLQALSTRCVADESTAVIESFRQIWPANAHFKSKSSPPCLDDSILAACRELVERRMTIHVGPVDQNLVGAYNQ